MAGLKLSAIGLLLGVCLLMPLAVQGQTIEPTAGAVQGTVFWSANDPTSVSDVKIVLYGDTIIISTVSDPEGKFNFSDLEPGVYFLQVT